MHCYFLFACGIVACGISSVIAEGVYELPANESVQVTTTFGNNFTGPGFVYYNANNEPKGVLIYIVHDDGDVEIDALVVSTDSQQGGIGTLLVEAAVKMAKSLEASEIYATVTTDNVAAIKTYNKCRFTCPKITKGTANIEFETCTKDLKKSKKSKKA
ncbi:acetyltransferase (GNAT) family domain-containing protein [Ditylenchus destructor]|nr:acetyltransferase (GNAT) family domain-containing protein [Ditylenchus destructor]